MNRYALKILFGLLIGHQVCTAAGPTPLPRPDLLPLAPDSIRQIQVIGKAVVDSRANVKPDPKAQSLRQAILDVKGELDKSAAATRSVTSYMGCRDTECADQPSRQSSVQGDGTSPSSTGMTAKRAALRQAMTEARQVPSLKYMVEKAEQIDAKVASLDGMQSEDRLRSLKELRRQLTPGPTPQDMPAKVRQVVVTYHSTTTHRKLVRGDVATVTKRKSQ